MYVSYRAAHDDRGNIIGLKIKTKTPDKLRQDSTAFSYPWNIAYPPVRCLISQGLVIPLFVCLLQQRNEGGIIIL